MMHNLLDNYFKSFNNKTIATWVKQLKLGLNRVCIQKEFWVYNRRMQNQFVMGMCRYGMDCCALFHVVYSGVHESYLTYGITVSGSMSDTKLKKLFLAQKKLLEFCLGIEKNSRINLKHVSELGLTKSKNFPLNFT